MMRIVFLLLFLGGLVLAVLPWVSFNLIDRDVGTWRVYDSVTGPLPAQARLSAEDAPVSVLLDMTTVGPTTLSDDRVAATLTATAAGKTLLAETMTFVDAPARNTNPQTDEKIFRDRAGVIPAIETGTYTFNVDTGGSDGVTIRSIDLVLRHETGGFDPRLQPAGFLLMVVGFIGLALSFGRRGGAPRNPNSQPPPPRWGRAGGR